jgi:GT2 family glycosyltransferase
VTPGVSVIIPNLNGAHYLSPCLKSVLAQGVPRNDLEILVIDNGSTDASVDIVQQDFPEIRLIANEGNIGFTRAINQGIEASVGDYILLLNNDTVMSAGALGALLTELRHGPVDLAGVQPLLLCAGDSALVDSAGIVLSPRFRAHDHLHGRSVAEASIEKVEIWGTCFACALIKREVFDQCAGLDPDFFAEWDDVDFSLRARWCGWRFMLTPEARVLHHRSPTSTQNPESKFIRLRRNQMLTYAKDLPISMAIFLTAYRFQRDVTMVIHYLRHRQLGAVVRSWKEYFSLLPRMIARRRQLQDVAQLSARRMKRQLQQFMRESSEYRANKSKPFVLFVPAGGIDNSSARTRMYAHLPFLRELGFRWHIGSYTYHKYDAPDRSKSILAKIWLELLPVRNLWAFLQADTLFFQKKSVVPWMVRCGRLLGKRIVYDFDDAMYLQPPDLAARAPVHAIETDTEFSPRLEWVLARADLTLVSSEELRRPASHRADVVKILPSVVSQIAEKPSVPNATPVIGWVGAPENQRYLRAIEDVLTSLTDEHPELAVWIITSRLMHPPPRFRHRFVPWSLATEAEMIPRFTLGVAPLDDDPWCRAKMNFKALVYMSYGVPVVASPVSSLSDELEDGCSVLLARQKEDWYQHMSSLLRDPVRRNEIAAGGLEVVRKRFWAPVRGAEFAAALRG